MRKHHCPLIAKNKHFPYLLSQIFICPLFKFCTLLNIKLYVNNITERLQPKLTNTSHSWVFPTYTSEDRRYSVFGFFFLKLSVVFITMASKLLYIWSKIKQISGFICLLQASCYHHRLTATDMLLKDRTWTPHLWFFPHPLLWQLWSATAAADTLLDLFKNVA